MQRKAAGPLEGSQLLLKKMDDVTGGECLAESQGSRGCHWPWVDELQFSILSSVLGAQKPPQVLREQLHP